jgi:hypothetical protein
MGSAIKMGQLVELVRCNTKMAGGLIQLIRDTEAER